ncbi:MAG: glycosyltransferase [Balneolaceae bacterium]
MTRVCFISHQSRLEGAERSLLELMQDLQSYQIAPYVVVLKEPGPLTERLDLLGIPWRSVPAPWWTRKTGSPDYPAAPVISRIVRASKEVAGILEEWQIDLVYSNTSVIGCGSIAALLSNRPHIWHIREAASQPENYQFLLGHHELENWIHKSSNRVLFNSEAVRSEWTNGLGDKSRTDVVYNRVSAPERVGECKAAREADVVIPMHNDPFVLKCMESLSRHRSGSLHRVWILDDMTRDEKLIEEVKRLAGKEPDLFRYERNSSHLGFVGTCNRGMELSGDRDVILLNSDTLVTGGWLERLREVAHARQEIGTVTPMSNNASLVSLPDLYTNNPDEEPERTARWLEQIVPADFKEIPTAHGFCVYIKREAIHTVGVFDFETFGMGYGEENDFSMRLRQAGMLNVAACRAYVYHKGAQSFGDEKKKQMVAENYGRLLEKHPDYPSLLKKFRAEDPFLDFREPLRILRSNPALAGSVKLVMAGSVIRLKGHLDAIRAIAPLVQKGVDLSLWICGPATDPDYLEELKRVSSESGLEGRVHFTGYLNQIFGILSFADLSLVCSSFESFGRVTLESMLCGTPVLGAEGGGTAELILHGETGWLYPPGDIDALSRQMEEVVSNRQILQNTGERAKEWAEEFQRANRSPETIADRIKKASGERNPAEGMEWLVRTLIEQADDSEQQGVIAMLRSKLGRMLSHRAVKD